MGNNWGDLSSILNVDELMEEVRHEYIGKLGFAQILNPSTGIGLGKNHGDTVIYEYFPKVEINTAPLSETDTVPMAESTPVRGSYLVQERGQGISFTRRLQDFARQDVQEQFKQQLADALARYENKLAYDQAVLTDWKMTFVNASTNNFVTNGTPSGTATVGLTQDKLFDLTAEAEDRNIPTFNGEHYVVITNARTSSGLAKTVLSTLADSGYAVSALNKEYGRVGNAILVKDTDGLIQEHATGLYDCFLFGDDAILKEISEDVSLRWEYDDFNRFVKFAFLYVAGYHKIYDQTLHGKEHIVHVTD